MYVRMSALLFMYVRMCIQYAMPYNVRMFGFAEPAMHTYHPHVWQTLGKYNSGVKHTHPISPEGPHTRTIHLQTPTCVSAYVLMCLVIVCTSTSAPTHCVNKSAHLLCVNKYAHSLCVNKYTHLLCVNKYAHSLCVSKYTHLLCVNKCAHSLCVNKNTHLLCVNKYAHLLCVNKYAHSLCTNRPRPLLISPKLHAFTASGPHPSTALTPSEWIHPLYF
jgi:hypothetical protein